MDTAPVALITGAASGIGRQLALLLAEDGYRIAGIDLQNEGLAALAAELKQRGRACATAVADVTSISALHAATVELEANLGPTQLLIASAGIGIETSGLAYSAEDVARVININLIGVSNSVAAVLPGMLERGRGHIVGLSSMASLGGFPRMLAYCASKAGVNALLEGLRAEVGPHGIAVTTICPGWIRTPMTASIQGKLDFLMELEEAARRIHAAIRARVPRLIFPRRLGWRLRLLGCLPTAWRDRIVMKMARRLQTAPRAPGSSQL